jgi:hypothetical protein
MCRNCGSARGVLPLVSCYYLAVFAHHNRLINPWGVRKGAQCDLSTYMPSLHNADLTLFDSPMVIVDSGGRGSGSSVAAHLSCSH